MQLRFDVTASSLPPEIKERLIGIAGNRMTSEGVLVIDAREHRTQAQNRDTARERLIALIERATHRPRKRRPTKPGKVAREQRLASKKKRSEVKAGRGRSRQSDE